MVNHEDKINLIFSSFSAGGTLKSRESSTVEFKEAFNKGSISKYAKTMAAYANNRGGYIIFGVTDNPRSVVGLRNSRFEDMKQEELTESLNALFSPAMEWECGIQLVDILEIGDNGEQRVVSKKIGWIYTEEAVYKPIIAQKSNSSEKISSGDVFYRYRARTQKIGFAEMVKIIEERMTKEREGLLRLLEVIRKSETTNLGIVNYANGRISTPYDIDVAIDRRLITEVLKKAKFIKEGSFREAEGAPVLKVTGNIDLAEEVPVPEGNPDETHPYIQKQLAEKLGISPQEVYALVWYFKMKEHRKFHIQVTTSRTSKTHKFSNHAVQFLEEKLKDFVENPDEFEKIKQEYRNRDK